VLAQVLQHLREILVLILCFLVLLQLVAVVVLVTQGLVHQVALAVAQVHLVVLVVLALLVKAMLVVLIQTQLLLIVRVVVVAQVLWGLMLEQEQVVLAAQVFVQLSMVSVFFMLVAVVVQLNIGLVEAVHLVVGCNL
jgi:hypothetical protein